MSTKSMRPPPRRTPWHNPNPTTGSSNNTSLMISNISKNNNLKEKNDGFQRPKKQSTQTPNPMTRSPNCDKITRTGSDPKKQPRPSKAVSENNKEKRKRKRKRKEEEEEGLGLGSEGGNTQILAGYLANEFLTKGTILGRRWEWDQVPSPRVEAQHEKDKYERYVQLAGLLKTDGAHLSGVVNPTQLASHLRLC